MPRGSLDSLRSLGTTLIAFVLIPAIAAAQTNPAAQSAQLWRLQHERAILDEFMTLLAVPNVSSDKPNIQRNAELIAKMIEARGLTPKLASVPGGSPVVVTDISRSTRRNGRRRRSSPCCATGHSRMAARLYACRQRARGSILNGASMHAVPATTRRRSWRCSPRSTRSSPPGCG